MKLALSFVFCAAAFAAPTVSNIRLDHLTHSTNRTIWDISGSAVSYHRVRYGTTTAYEGSTYGGIVVSGWGSSGGIGSLNTDIMANLTGLRYGTFYHICPQSSDDGGSTWSTCVDTTFTTPGLPSPHPALPIAPSATVSKAMPDTTGYLLINDVASDCSNLAAKLSAAETARASTGAILVWPANCDTATGLTLPSPADVTSPASKYLLVVPEWPLGSSFTVPFGTRVTSSTTGFAKLTLTSVDPDISTFYRVLSATGNHHWRFIGFELTTAVTSEDPTTTTDPAPYGQLAELDQVDHFYFDRCYFHGQGYPSRIERGVYFSGNSFAMFDSELSNVDAWKAGIGISDAPTGGMNVSATSTVLTITAGTYYLGSRICTLASSATATITAGSASGNALAYYDMACTLKVVAPSGISATCVNCTFSTTATPTFTTIVNGSGNRAYGALAQVTVTSGAWAAIDVWESNHCLSAYACEGPTGMIGLCGAGQGLAGAGGGPVLIDNNKIEAENIGVHMDDSCGVLADYNNPGFDYSILRNYFTLRPSWYPRDPTYDHKRRWHRNHLEFKTGKRILINGNTLENGWTSLTYGFAIALTSTPGSQPPRPGPDGTGLTDIDITNNIIQNSAAGILQGGADVLIAEPATLRIRIYNTFVQTTPRYESGTGSTRFGPALLTRGAIEDVTINHNTVMSDSPGTIGANWWYHIKDLIEGVVISDSILSSADYDARYGTYFEGLGTSIPNCFGLHANDMFDCGLVSGGLGNQVYTFAGNLLVPWLSANVTNWTAAYTGHTVVPGATAAIRIAAVGCVQGAQWRCVVPVGSPYLNSGTDGLTPGVLWGYTTGGISGRFTGSGSLTLH